MAKKTFSNAQNVAKAVSKFFIKEKKELIITYASTYADQLPLGYVCEHLEVINENRKLWNWVFFLEHGGYQP